MSELYNPLNVHVNIGTHRVTGFMDGTFVKVERGTPENFKMHTGAHGDVSYTKTNDPSGMITLTLKQTSPSKRILDQMAQLPNDFPASVINKSDSNYMAVASKARVIQLPGGEFGDEEGSDEYIIGCADLIVSNL